MDKPSYVYGNNMSVVTNASKPELMLKKKSNSICYHAVHKAIVMGEDLIAHIPTKKNLADLFMKVLYGQSQQLLVDWILWDCTPVHRTKTLLGWDAANDWPLTETLCGTASWVNTFSLCCLSDF